MTGADRPLHWVVGGGGLLGGAVVTEARREGAPVHVSAVPWSESGSAIDVLGDTADELLGRHRRVRLAWCAGAGVVGTSAQELADELDVFTRVLDRVAGASRRQAGAEVDVFLASSAGGLYAGSSGPPFTEEDAPEPLAPYGETKLAMERAATATARAYGVRLLIGRIANLYGPGQRLDKPQGIVSQLCRAQFEHRPLSIYVSLDTARDYLYVADAARMVLAGLDRLAGEPAGAVVTKILCSGAATSLASILGELHRISKRRPPIVLGVSPTARFQASDLRFRSVVWPELDPLATTTFPAGMAATYRDVAASLRAPGPR